MQDRGEQSSGKRETYALDAIQRHVAGATVTHTSPFANLQVPQVVTQPGKELVDQWIKPLYLDFFKPGAESLIASLWSQMTPEIAGTLLSYFDWRPRIVGAHLVALRKMDVLTSLVGRLLLRSDVCFAGGGYCLALARINTQEARQFLYEYLDYYLTRPDLDFDQARAMAAVIYLDKLNGTNESGRFEAGWSFLIRDKPHPWNLERSCSAFCRQMARIEALAKENAAPQADLSGPGCISPPQR